MYIIYKYTNIINGKSYIGKTNNPRARHKFHSKADGSSPHFHAAISKYKFESFEKQVLMENIPINEMAERYGVKLSTIDDIRLGRTWKQLPRSTKHRKRISHKRTRLTEEVVKNVIFDGCTHAEAAEKYSVNLSTVRGIRANSLIKWKYIDRSNAPVYARQV